MGFFAEGDPFRRYKAAVTHAGITAAQDGTATAAPQAGTTAAGFPERELAVPEAGWQQTLLFSARRGEAITGFVHPRQAIIQLPCRPVRRFPSPPVTKKAARGG